MPSARVNGVDIRYEDTGGDGLAVLFSHGFLMDHTMFDAQVAALSGDYRCIAWDERGFGGTRATGEFSYWDSADDAVGLLDHLGVDQAVFVGMSQGGFLSLRAALAHPDRVHALVLIDTAADTDDPETTAGNEGMLHVFVNGTDDDRASLFQAVAALILADDELEAEWIPKWTAIDTDQLALAGKALVGRDDISERVSQIRCPIMSIHGVDDQGIRIERAEALAAAASDHRGFVKVEGAAHAPNMTHADRVNPALANFLASL